MGFTLEQIRQKHGNAQPKRSMSVQEIQQTAETGGRRTFMDKVKDFAGGAVYGFSSPGRTIQKGLSKAADKALGTEGFGVGTKDDFERITRTDVDTGSGKFGRFAGETVHFAVPGGGVAKLTAKAPLAVRAGAQGASSFGVESLNRGEVGASSFAAGATDAALPYAGRVLGLGGELLKGLGGGLTGQGVDVIDAALKNPGPAFRAAGKNSTEGLREVATGVKNSVAALSKKAGKEYAEKVKSAGVEQIADKNVTRTLQQRLADVAEVGFDEAENVPIFKNSPYIDAEETQLKKLSNLIGKWDDFTPEGMNTLARRVNRFRRGTAEFENFDRVVNTVKNDVREFVGERFPQIADANRIYAEKMDLIDEIDNVLRTNQKYQGREGIRKTAESLGRIFSSGKEFSREAIQELEEATGMNIIGTIAGLRLSDSAPRAASSLGDAAGNIIRPFASVTARNVVPAVGAVQQQVVNRVMSIPGVPETARAAIVNAVADLFADPEDELVQSGNDTNGNK